MTFNLRALLVPLMICSFKSFRRKLCLNSPFALHFVLSVALGRLYAIGGLDGSSRLNTVEMFDPKTGVWQKVASMNYQKSALGAAVLNDRIYVCGGYDGVASLRTCEVYNPDQNR